MHQNIKILLIDDENIVISSCLRILKPEGYDVTPALSGRQGIELLQKEKFDLVITDIKMPDISGMEVLDHVREHYPGVQVIMITGFSSVANAVECIKKGAFDYVPKPFLPEELLSAVRDASIKRMQAIDRIYSLEMTPHKYGFDNIIGSSGKMLKVYDLIQKVAQTDISVLITGESGTGKELIARAIYNHSLRKENQFIAIDCSTFAQSVLESELFGHTKGSFTGAVSSKKGIFEIADGGTLFLDEVSNIPMDTQSKLLRVLEQHEIRPLGSESVKKVDIRLIAATNRDLKTMADSGKFREDLFYRLNAFPIGIPPLRERPEDIPLLAYHFLRQSCQTLDKRVNGFSKEAMGVFLSYDWPGNVRELKHAVEKIVLMSDEDTLTKDKLKDMVDRELDSRNITIPKNNEELKKIKKDIREKSVEDVEKYFVIEALARNNWSITKAAEETGMQRTNFQALIKKYNIQPKTYNKKFSDIDDL